MAVRHGQATATFEAFPFQMAGRAMTVKSPSRAHRQHSAGRQWSAPTSSSIFQLRGVLSGIRELSFDLILVHGTIAKLPVGSGISSR